jgi:hypothetical protein
MPVRGCRSCAFLMRRPTNIPKYERLTCVVAVPSWIKV